MPSSSDLQQQLDSAEDALRRARLRTMQRVAGGLLLLAFGVFCLARSLLALHPAWGYVSAFAEAAMVGAVADWFAVVALFRHPLGIPVWHTAIIPNSKDGIGRNLGQFVESHFITEQGIAERIRQANPAGLLGAWLVVPGHSDQLGLALAKAVRGVLKGLDHDAMNLLVRDAATRQLSQFDIASNAGKLLDLLVAGGSHQQLLDSMLRGISGYLGEEKNQQQAIDFLIAAFGVENVLYKVGTAAIGPRALRSLKKSTHEVLHDPAHPARARFTGWVEAFLLHLKDDPAWHEFIARHQQETLASARMQALLGSLWGMVMDRLLDDLGRDGPATARQVAMLAGKVGDALANDAQLVEGFNRAIESGSVLLVRKHRGEVGQFIEAQLARWSREEMSDRIELAIGRDLQFIRINGTLVGGLVGLAIYTVTRLLG
ncbi:probable membrane protein STY4873 [Polaromonas sp. CG9_12]|nr:probable membrane protein STY4873 [Polaromonas sp. CG9_12]